MPINEKIQTLRRERGLSQEELAITLGVSRQAVSKWETGDATPDTDKVIALANYFEVTTDYLLRDIAPESAGAGAGSHMPPAQLESEVPFLLCMMLGVCVIGLILLLYGHFISASTIPSLIGILVQICSLSFATGLGLHLKTALTPRAGGEFLRKFWRGAVWLAAPLPVFWLTWAALRLIPSSLLSHINAGVPTDWKAFVFGSFFLAPVACYVVICLIVTILLRKKSE